LTQRTFSANLLSTIKEDTMNNGDMIGDFTVKSGELIITDPCYDDDGHLGHVTKDVKKGTWVVFAQYCGDNGRVSGLMACHVDHKVSVDSSCWEHVSSMIGVDSGQAGIYDRKYFKNDRIVEGVERTEGVGIICPEEPWYSINCDRTLGEASAGTIPFGCVSSSGYGDGCYDCYEIRLHGKVVAVKIVFIDENIAEDHDDPFYCNHCDDEDEED
jgi:hypothetical protein